VDFEEAFNFFGNKKGNSKKEIGIKKYIKNLKLSKAYYASYSNPDEKHG